LKILITGANGLLGSNLCLMYSKENEVIATSRTKPNINNCLNYKLGITNKEDMKIVEELHPDMIIHCAALVNVDYCEEHPTEAHKINFIGSKNIAESAKKTNSYLVHISTDAVFDGKKGYYDEDDPTNPLNVYGQTKLEAEKIIQKITSNHVIIRTNIYGWNKQNKFSLAEWMLDKLEKKQELQAFKDTFFSPMLVNNLGEAILELYDLKHKGILHLAGSEGCSKLDFAKKIAKIFNINNPTIIGINSSDLKLKAKRPKNMVLNVNKAKSILKKTKILNVEKGLTRFKQLRDSGYLNIIKKNE